MAGLESSIDLMPLLERVGPVATEQTTLIGACADLIDRQVPADEPLWQVCPHADECWRRDRGPRPEPMRARVPYVGPQYAERRVAVVGINSRDDGMRGDEIKATAAVIEHLRRGNREYGHRSYFHYRAASAVYNALRSLDGQPPIERPEPEVVADALLASARLQAVQCSPDSTSRRTPTPEMVRNCPPFLLRDQLEILAPRVLLLLGQAAHQAIERPALSVAWDTTWQANGRCFSRGRTSFAGKPMTILAFHHPSATRAGGWSRSWSAYLTSLEDQDLATAG